MRRMTGWLALAAVLILLLAACGPEMDASTPSEEVAEAPATATAAQEDEPVGESANEPTDEPPDEVAEPAAPSTGSDNWHSLGSPEAPVTIIEYSDFQWPFCARYVRETFPQILETYVDSGQVQYVYRNFPLFSIHPQAQKAAEASECAGEQGAYWEMHEALFENQDDWSGNQSAEKRFEGFASDLGLDQDQFDACLDDGKYADLVQAHYQEGLAEGVTGTPAFRINGAELSGAQPFAAFQQQIDFFLAGGEPPTLEVGADSFRSLGQADAPVVITEFSDYQWPACASVAREVIPDLIEQYVDTGKVRFVYREFPLGSIHPAAQKASEAAICAGKQGKYWEMNEYLFETASEWGAQGGDPSGVLKTYAVELELNQKEFEECLDSGEAAVVVQGDQMVGESLGVNATPYFFVNDLPVRGGLPIEALGRIIDYEAAGGPTPEIVPGPGDPRQRGDGTTARAMTVAFVDYASPESAQHATKVLPQLVDTYVDDGRLLYILHPWSDGRDTPGARAAVAAECAGEQGKYWEMHDKLFEQQREWLDASEPMSLFTGYAEAAELDAADFAECLDSERAALRVESGPVVGSLYGVPAAPVFLFNNGQGQEGSPSFEEFEAVIESILSGQ